MSIDDELSAAELRRIAFAEIANTELKPPCGCPECVINGKRSSMPVQHDCSYALARSALVPQAEQVAMRDGRFSVRIFNETMDKLAAPLLHGSNGNGSERERQRPQNCETGNGAVSSGGNGSDAAATLYCEGW